jgi:hypothetical protein
VIIVIRGFMASTPWVQATWMAATKAGDIETVQTAASESFRKAAAPKV